MRQNSQPGANLPFYRGEVVQIYQEGVLPPDSGEYDTDIFLRYNCTDKNKNEVEQYLDKWNREILFDVISGPDQDGRRRIKCSNAKINESLNIGPWTDEIVNNIVTEWNARYPESQLFSEGFTAKDWICDGYFTSGQAAEFQQVVYDAGDDFYDRHAIWKMKEASCQAFESTGGVKTGTAAQLVNNNLVYGPEATE